MDVFWSMTFFDKNYAQNDAHKGGRKVGIDDKWCKLLHDV